jgi:hypothetical protein
MLTKKPLVSSQGDSVRPVYVKEQFVIPPLSAWVLNVQLEGQSLPSSCVCINPVELLIQRFICSCRIFESHWKAKAKESEKFPSL